MSFVNKMYIFSGLTLHSSVHEYNWAVATSYKNICALLQIPSKVDV